MSSTTFDSSLRTNERNSDSYPDVGRVQFLNLLNAPNGKFPVGERQYCASDQPDSGGCDTGHSELFTRLPSTRQQSSNSSSYWPGSEVGLADGPTRLGEELLGPRGHRTSPTLQTRVRYLLPPYLSSGLLFNIAYNVQPYSSRSRAEPQGTLYPRRTSTTRMTLSVVATSTQLLHKLMTTGRSPRLVTDPKISARTAELFASGAVATEHRSRRCDDNASRRTLDDGTRQTVVPGVWIIFSMVFFCLSNKSRRVHQQRDLFLDTDLGDCEDLRNRWHARSTAALTAPPTYLRIRRPSISHEHMTRNNIYACPVTSIERLYPNLNTFPESVVRSETFYRPWPPVSEVLDA
ncbi:hypothetical protein BIW11_03683 [Tropilaelaps mercedesae]|uniref:Uncharacterized protein n=1 Tax=Tropilaelaps mercedesae TaxID=418985 RepID=A0A1V9XHN8_9ACAR|nr:hypothetical protein BIW11_03683 [Tropilaelaps mercedesae]